MGRRQGVSMLRRQLVRTAELLAPRLLYRYRLRKYSSYEPEQALVPYFCDKAHLAIDVGANIGIYSGQIVKHAKACCAFEANPYLARQLQRAAVPGLTVMNAAVSDRAGELTLYIPKSTPGLATVEQAHPDAAGAGDGKGQVSAVKVQAVRLDDLEFENVSFIKIDVEGHEEAVLRGAGTTIDKHRPFMLIESENRHNPGSVGRVCNVLLNRRYECFILKRGCLKPLSEFDEKRDQDPAALGNRNGEIYINNFVFIPSERFGTFVQRSRLLEA